METRLEERLERSQQWGEIMAAMIFGEIMPDDALVSFIADLGSTLEFMSICMIIFMINQI
jgi:hypothetical protein